MKKFLIYALKTIAVIIAVFILFVLYASIKEFNPPPESALTEHIKGSTIYTDSTYGVMCWNIGYGGLGANMDFFYDGGKMVRDSKENVRNNFNAITRQIERNDTIDFYLLQEVDFNSKRSYRMNQGGELSNTLSRFKAYSGINYQVDFVPVPPTNPLGKVNSGIVTYTRFRPESVIRYGFTGNYAWPTRLFMLKRCYLVSRFPTNNDNDFVLVNIHNSAYDDGSLRAEQLGILEEFALQEYKKGNYILFGGDWNQSPDGFKPNFVQPFDTINVSYLPSDFLPGWERYYSDTVPTNRRITVPYTYGETPVTVIDYYIASPNIFLSEITCTDLNFNNSDHHPVTASFRLLK